jgi:hypothetical protein
MFTQVLLLLCSSSSSRILTLRNNLTTTGNKPAKNQREQRTADLFYPIFRKGSDHFPRRCLCRAFWRCILPFSRPPTPHPRRAPIPELINASTNLQLTREKRKGHNQGPTKAPVLLRRLFPNREFSIDFFLLRRCTRRGSIRYFEGRASSLRAAVLGAAARSSFAQALAWLVDRRSR